MKFNLQKTHLNTLATIGLYLLIFFIFFFDSFTKEVFWGGDFIAYYLPNSHFLLSQIKEGVLPLWQPYSFMGLPFLFQPALTLSYFPIWIIYILNLLLNPVLNFSILGKSLMLYNIVHLLLGAYGTFLVLHKMFKTSWYASFVGGLFYSIGFFNLYKISDSSVLIQRMWFPLLIYFTLTYINNSTKQNFFKLIFINFTIFTLGYPYNFIYFFSAQLLLVILVNIKKIWIFIYSIFISTALAAFFLLPQINIYLNSNRLAEAVTNSNFHKLYSEIPTHLLNFFLPLYGNGIYNINDPNNYFTYTNFTFGVVGIVLFLYGLVSLKKESKSTWLILCLIIPPIYSFGYYFNSIEILNNFIPFIDKLRSHPQSLLISYFAGIILIGKGTDNILNGFKSTIINYVLILTFISGLVLLALVPMLNSNTFQESSSSGWYLALSRFLVFLIFTLLSVNLSHIINKKLFVFLITFLFVIEMNIYFDLIGFNNLPGNYQRVLNNTNLIPFESNSADLFRYEIEGNQFAYNSSIHRQFSRFGYETTPYGAAYLALKLPYIDSLAFSNVRYIVTTNNNLVQQFPNEIKLVKTLTSNEYEYNQILSFSNSLPWYTTESKNTHYIYEFNNYLPRFYISSQIKNCNNDCVLTSNFNDISLVENKDFDFSFQDPLDTSISVDMYRTNKIVLNIKSSSEVFISSSEVWDNGWKIKLNGENSKIYNTNGGFRGFIAPNGNSTVEMYYFPPYFKLGLFITILAILNIIYLSTSNTRILKFKRN